MEKTYKFWVYASVTVDIETTEENHKKINDLISDDDIAPSDGLPYELLKNAIITGDVEIDDSSLIGLDKE